MYKFIKELYCEDYPFINIENKKKGLHDFIYELQNNKYEVLQLISSQLGGSPSEYSLSKTGWYRYKDCEVNLLNYCFNNYESDLFNNKNDDWSYKARIYEDMPKLRTEILNLLEDIRFDLCAVPHPEVQDIIDVIIRKKMKEKVVAILEVEEVKRKFSTDKSYPLGSLHSYLFKFIDLIADFKTNKSNFIHELSHKVGLNRLPALKVSHLEMMSDDELNNDLLYCATLVDIQKVNSLKDEYIEYICAYEDVVQTLKKEFFYGLNTALEESQTFDAEGWCKLTPDFEYKSDYSLIRSKKMTCKIKSKSIEPLKALINQYRHQDSADILLTKENLINISSYRPKNIKEFRVSKSMFPKDPMRSLVVYDKEREGYKLAI